MSRPMSSWAALLNQLAPIPPRCERSLCAGDRAALWITVSSAAVGVARKKSTEEVDIKCGVSGLEVDSV
jgi:hypothetical protein